ncbi:transglycosylase SLT domain-containing protein [Frankia sp. AgB1.9]|uniref:transglycosylase SLT domain-containing protein n=1 Tax=unclassified Frankia TaxID=2632575 RepID=UPI00193280F7|nr:MULTISPECIES: transglycosylase SLT domain-containing protein [unclassified Frankia]MBL7487397.1 transglycosylase SLT domain-containing protein [Frankia sp. AgW1.1]MBL7551183.1 transglycosylase SLT domain-containing protein [Frankia sp. AgB1.9]MBL7621611.1 transglycosylase SLT domain-containing protein [Frankia sp. AgB1.8]
MRPRSPLARPETPGCSARRRPDRATARGTGLVAGVLLVAAVGGASVGGGWGPYRVGAGDSLWALAARHGTTVDRIRVMNRLTDDGLSIGDLLYLPGSGSVAAGPTTAEAATAGTPPAPAQPPGGHVVQSGESLSLLAARTGQSVADLAAQNGLGPGDGLRIGQVLLLSPGAAAAIGGQTAGAGAAATAPSGGAASTGDAVSSGVSARVAAIQALVRAEAARQGLDPALALAVASVESSFNPRAVSRTGAVGVMQLMPRTARWLGAQLGQPIDRTDPADNITGGVAFLRYLLAATSSNLPIAIGAYYQGLDSVRRSGFFPDTAVYVAKVTARQAKFT